MSSMNKFKINKNKWICWCWERKLQRYNTYLFMFNLTESLFCNLRHYHREFLVGGGVSFWSVRPTSPRSLLVLFGSTLTSHSCALLAWKYNDEILVTTVHSKNSLMACLHCPTPRPIQRQIKNGLSCIELCGGAHMLILNRDRFHKFPLGSVYLLSVSVSGNVQIDFVHSFSNTLKSCYMCE